MTDLTRPKSNPDPVAHETRLDDHVRRPRWRSEPFDAQATYDAAAGDHEDASRDYWAVPVAPAPSRRSPSVRASGCSTRPAAPVRRSSPRRRTWGPEGTWWASTSRRPCSASRSSSSTTCPAAVRGPWDLVRPGSGCLLVAVLGEAFFDPMRDVFVEAVAAVRPGLHVHEPWRRTEDPAVFRQVLAEAGVGEVELTSADDRLPLPSPDDWWRIVLGTGLRRTVMGLEPAEADAVRERCGAHIRGRGVREVVLGTHLGRAVKT